MSEVRCRGFFFVSFHFRRVLEGLHEDRLRLRRSIIAVAAGAVRSGASIEVRARAKARRVFTPARVTHARKSACGRSFADPLLLLSSALPSPPSAHLFTPRAPLHSLYPVLSCSNPEAGLPRSPSLSLPLRPLDATFSPVQTWLASPSSLSSPSRSRLPRLTRRPSPTRPPHRRNTPRPAARPR